MSYNPRQARDPKGSPTGGQWSSGDASGSPGAAIADERTAEPGQNQPSYNPDVEHDADGDGVSDAARVGVPAHEVPPPPPVPRLPNLTPHERAIESAFADAFQRDPDGMARKYLEMVRASKDPSKFEADTAKNLFEPWAGKPDMDPEKRAQMRSTMNTPLHQTASAIAKRAFLMHLDEMSDTDRAKGMLVTVGGCGAGKGHALKTLADNVPELNQRNYGVTWDSAGDQNATENPWLLKEAAKRGIPVTYVYVSADPKVSWADPKRGVVQRAMNPEDGRMVDAQVFADSYVIGAKNHAAFSKTYAGSAKFVYLSNGEKVERLDRVPDSDINRSRKDLHDFAVDTIHKGKMPPRVRRGALMGQRIW